MRLPIRDSHNRCDRCTGRHPQIAMMRACLVSRPAAGLDDVRADCTRDLDLLIFRAVERVAAFGLVLGLVMEFLRGSCGAIRRTISAPLGQTTRQGQTPKPASAAPSHHSNAPIEPEGQSILSKKIAHPEAILSAV
jgi:hypothetical protein